MNIIFKSGWYNQENDGLRDFVWSKSESSVTLSNQEVYKYLNLYIGSPRNNTLTIGYKNETIVEVSINSGWHIYQIPYGVELNFKCKSLNIPNESRDLAFMLSNIECTNQFVFDNDVIEIENLKSEWIDIVYILYADTNSEIDLVTNNSKYTYPLYIGGQRSISFKINNNDIVNNTFKFNLKKDKNVNLKILSIINRENFYDFLNLKKFEDDSSIRNKTRTKQIIKNERLRIQWFVTWKCNMSCEYCWQESAGSIYRTIGGKTTKTAKDWADAINNLNPCRLYLTGGEPSLFRELPQMFTMLNKDIKLDMTSNFGKTFDLKNWKNLDPDQWNFIFFSLHPTQLSNIDDFFNKLEKFFENFDSRKVGIEMVLHPKNVSLIDPQRIIDFSKKYNMVTPHLDNFVDSNVSKLDRTQPKSSVKSTLKTSFDTKYSLSNKTDNIQRQPIYCPAGWKKINVDFEGNIFTCMSAIDRSKLFHSSALPHYNSIGNIFDPNFKIKEEPVICWESFRCSACDYQDIQHAWTRFSDNFDYQLPIVE